MKTSYKFALAAISTFVVGAAAMQVLQAQTKPKAYYVSESEVLDVAANAAFVPIARETMKAGGGRAFRTGGGKVVGLEGAAPTRVVIFEWENLEQAEAFFKSKNWTDLKAQRDKGQKTIRSYLVEALN